MGLCSGYGFRSPIEGGLDSADFHPPRVERCEIDLRYTALAPRNDRPIGGIEDEQRHPAIE